ncbi:MAG: hypothetical protein PHV06_00355 [bacterium]|nr:hypothetical protein [bacterium]
MKKRDLIVIISIALSIFLALSCFNKKPEKQTNKFKSPDGNYIILTSVKQNEDSPNQIIKIKLRDKDKNEIFKEQIKIQKTSTWNIYWDGNQKFIFESSEKGKMTWEIDQSGNVNLVPGSTSKHLQN